MKVENLLERRKKLKGKVKSLGKQLTELGQEIQQKDLSTFISSGTLPSPDGHRLLKLKNEHKYLEKMGLSLDLEIVKAQDEEREKERTRARKKADEFAQVRVKLGDKIRHHLVKTEALREESRKIHTEERELRLQANRKERKTPEFSGRLCEMEKFLSSHILVGSEDIEERVLEARTHNKKVLSQDRIGLNDKVFQNFKIRWEGKSAKILEFSMNEQPAKYMLELHNRKDTISKEEFLKEIT